MTEFECFSTLHYVSLAVCLILAILAVVLCRRWRGTEKEAGIRMTIGIGCLVVWIVSAAYRLFFVPFDWESSLPLHFCNIANLIGAMAIFGKGRLFKAVLYFWSFSLCIWAFLTPELSTGPALPGFWIFWGYHVFIILAVVVILVLYQFQPNGRDFRNAAFFTIAYVGFLLVPNNIHQWNYGYVGPSKPSLPTIIDFLGPYPLRLVWMFLIGAFLFFLLLLPWMRRKSLHNN